MGEGGGVREGKVSYSELLDTAEYNPNCGRTRCVKQVPLCCLVCKSVYCTMIVSSLTVPSCCIPTCTCLLTMSGGPYLHFQDSKPEGKDLPTPSSTPTQSRKNRRRSNLFNVRCQVSTVLVVVLALLCQCSA